MGPMVFKRCIGTNGLEPALDCFPWSMRKEIWAHGLWHRGLASHSCP